MHRSSSISKPWHPSPLKHERVPGHRNTCNVEHISSGKIEFCLGSLGVEGTTPADRSASRDLRPVIQFKFGLGAKAKRREGLVKAAGLSGQGSYPPVIGEARGAEMNMGKISVRFQRDGPKCRPRAVARGQRRICISLLEGVESPILDTAQPGWQRLPIRANNAKT